VAGLVLAAPFGAVMATVSSYLVVIASGIVRDVYQRFVNPSATQYELKRLSYIVMVVVGAIAVVANIKPVAYLQVIVVFSGTGAAATFCIPVLMLAYWRRATVLGAFASMVSGAVTVVGLYLIGFLGLDDPKHYADGVVPWIFSHGNPMIGAVSTFRPHFLLEFDPIIWGLASSLVAGVVVSLLTRPVDADVVSRFFDAETQPEQSADGQAGGE
jgi:SSS family solute:Na+ symporter/sodium/pantothenate symporter